MMFGAFVLGELFVRLPWQFLLASCAAFGALGGWCVKKKRSRWAVSLLLFFLGGFLCAWRMEEPSSPERWLEKQEGEGYAEFCGAVYRLEEREEEIWYYVNGCVSEEKDGRPGGVILILKKDQIPELLPGMKVKAAGVLEEFSTAGNKGQFDFKNYYRSLNLAGRMEGAKVQVTEGRANGYRAALTRLRAYLSGLLSAIGKEREAAVLKAVLLGEKWETPEEVENLYSANGISHLLAISGLHISFIGMGIYKLLRRFTGSYLLAGGLGAFFVISYGIMVGEGVSAMRACLMFVVLALGNGVGRTYDMLSALSLAGILLLAQTPLALYQAAFQLSFGAVLGIGFFGPLISGLLPKRWKCLSSFTTTLAVSFVTLPALLFHFFEFPIQSLWLNLLVIPMMSFLMGTGLLGLLAGAIWVPLGRFFLGTVSLVLDGYDRLCAFGQSLGWNLILGRPPEWKLVFYGIFLALLGLFLQNRRKKGPSVFCLLGVLGCFFLSLSFLSPLPDGKLWVTALDVGQGDSIVLKGPEGTVVLLDGGSTSDSQAGTMRILPYLKSEGIGELDYCVFTHLDEDHVSGVRQLVGENFPINKVLISIQTAESPSWKEWEALFQRADIPVFLIGKGDVLRLGEAQLTCLWPDKEGEEDGNNASLVFSLTWDRFSMVLTGDLEKEGEEELLKEGALPRQITVLKAGHHGSKESSSASFLEQLSPKIVWISCGEDNPYGHPHKEAVERFRKAGSAIHMTKEKGQLSLRTDGRRILFSSFR